MKNIAYLVIASLLSTQAWAFATKDEIEQSLHGNTPKKFLVKKKTKAIKLEPLEHVIPKSKQFKKAKPVSFLDWLMPSAYAMGCKQVAGPVVPSPVVAPVAPVTPPAPAPTVTSPVQPSPSATPSATPAPQPTEIDLRSRDTEIKTQIGGTCTAYGLTAAIENAVGTHTDLSEWDLWNDYLVYSVFDAITAGEKSLICKLTEWPDGNKNPNSTCAPDRKWGKVTDTNYDQDGASFVKGVLSGKVGYIGMSVPGDLANCNVTINPTTTTVTSGGHAVEVAGVLQTSFGPTLILKNSWGTDCGDNGYQYMPISTCDRSDMYCYFWTIDSVTAP